MIIDWIYGLFRTNKGKRTVLSRDEVEKCEAMMYQYHRDMLVEYFDISQSTYYAIKNKKHKYNKKV